MTIKAQGLFGMAKIIIIKYGEHMPRAMQLETIKMGIKATFIAGIGYYRKR
mgnify:CR=1 FL=1